MIATERRPHTAPIFWHRCPVHGLMVASDGDGALLGRCDGCSTEAAAAQRSIEHGDLPIQLLLRGAS